MADPDTRHPDTMLGIAILQDHGHERSELTTSANAHLIAAAPELYSSVKMALEGINRLAEEYGAIPEYLDDITSVLEASLAKARGETQ